MKTFFGFNNFTRILSEYIFGVLFFTMMIWTICLEMFYGEAINEISLANRQLSLVTVLALSSIVYFYFRPKLYKKYEFWQLKNDFLTRGLPANLEIYFPSVELVIKGLPEPLPGMQKLLYNLTRLKLGTNNAQRHQYENTLILKLGPSTYLPLYLYHLGDGDKLMIEISNYFEDRTLSEPELTYNERKSLTPWKCNKLVNL